MFRQVQPLPVQRFIRFFDAAIDGRRRALCALAAIARYHFALELNGTPDPNWRLKRPGVESSTLSGFYFPPFIVFVDKANII